MATVYQLSVLVNLHITTPFPFTSTIYPLVYLYVHAKLLDNACDSQYVILQQLAGKCLHLDGALGGLQTCCHLLFDPESLLQQYSQCPVLTAQTTLQDIMP